MALPLAPPNRGSFLLKIALSLVMVIAADAAFWTADAGGSVIGGFALLWAIVSFAVHPSLRQNRHGLAALAAACVMAAIQFYQPSLLAWALFWSALSIAVLAPRSAAFGDAWQHAIRLLLHGLAAAFVVPLDLIKLSAARRRGKAVGGAQLFKSLLLPIAGSAIFLFLFAAANPIIEGWFARIDIGYIGAEDVIRCIFWAIIFVVTWASMRPFRPRFDIQPIGELGPRRLPGVTMQSVLISLVLFNAIFALQNGLDIAFIWGAERLPEQYTLAEYAHRGAYPLIATALLAGLFILLTSHPDSAMGKSTIIRALIIIWIAQNIFLVGSTIERTLLYVESYSLTRLRIASLIWMGLVVLGLLLILWRMLSGKSFRWLVGANSIAALAVLTVCSVIDLGAISARYNTQHAKEVGGKGVHLDFAYLCELNSAALLPLAQLEQQPNLPDAFRRRVTQSRNHIQYGMMQDQKSWQSWVWRDSIRLSQVRTQAKYSRSCYDGYQSYEVAPAQSPLTNEARR